MLRIIDLFFFEFVTEFSSYFINIFVFVAQLARELQAEEGDDDLSPSAPSTPRVVSSRTESSSAAALDAAIDDVLASAPRARSREESGISATLAAVRNSFLSTLAYPLCWSLALLTFLCTYILCCVPMQGLSAAEDITSGGRAGGAREGAAGSAVGETLSTEAQSGVTEEAAAVVEDDAAAERREKRERLRRLLAEQERAEVRALCC